MARTIQKPVSTVQSWKDRGSIPDDHKWPVLTAANMRGLTLGREDFFPLPPEEKREATTP